jgi:GTP pyrophosphokinase
MAIQGGERYGHGSIKEEAICLMDFTPGIAVHFAECCHPILGDKIIGTLIPQRGIEVHLSNCDHLSQRKNVFVRIKWNKEDETESPLMVRLRIVILNRTESFSSITGVISSNGATMTNIKVEHRSIDFFDLLVDIKVNDVIHLGEVQAALRTCAHVRSVKRL